MVEIVWERILSLNLTSKEECKRAETFVFRAFFIHK